MSILSHTCSPACLFESLFCLVCFFLSHPFDTYTSAGFVSRDIMSLLLVGWRITQFLFIPPSLMFSRLFRELQIPPFFFFWTWSFFFFFLLTSPGTYSTLFSLFDLVYAGDFDLTSAFLFAPLPLSLPLHCDSPVRSAPQTLPFLLFFPPDETHLIQKMDLLVLSFSKGGVQHPAVCFYTARPSHNPEPKRFIPLSRLRNPPKPFGILFPQRSSIPLPPGHNFTLPCKLDRLRWLNRFPDPRGTQAPLKCPCSGIVLFFQRCVCFSNPT